MRTIEKVEVKAGYDFHQIEDNGQTVFFTLTPQKVIVPSNREDLADVTIVFSDCYGGSFDKGFNSIIFNISPVEILVGGVKLASFEQSIQM